MKKLLFCAIFTLLMFPLVSRAESLLGFLDGNMYDTSGTWKCLFLMDGNCYDINQKILMTRPAGYVPPVISIPASTPQTVYVPVYMPQPVFNDQPTVPPVENVEPPVSTPATSTPVNYENSLSCIGNINSATLDTGWIGSPGESFTFRCDSIIPVSVVSLDIVITNLTPQQYNNGTLVIKSISGWPYPITPIKDLTIGYGKSYAITLNDLGSGFTISFSIQKLFSASTENTGYSLKIGNIVVKDEEGNTHITRSTN